MSSADSDSSSSSEDETLCNLDEFGRPLSRPVFGSVEESTVLSRVREFLPQFKASVAQSFEPRIKNTVDNSSIVLHRSRSMSGASSGSAESASSYGVEIEVGCGVFDVMGEIDEGALSREGIPTVDLDLPTNKRTSSVRPEPLIQEIDQD